MAVTRQQRVRLPPELWALVETAAAARRISASSIVADALKAYFGPRQDLAEAARIVADLQCERAAIVEKIDLLFLATSGNIDDI